MGEIVGLDHDMERRGMYQAWEPVRHCVTFQEALVIRSVLEASDIECFLPDESLLGMRPELALALGGARVLVRPADRERALEALRLADVESGASAALDEDSER